MCILKCVRLLSAVWDRLSVLNCVCVSDVCVCMCYFYFSWNTIKER